MFLCVSCIVLDTSEHKRRSVTPPQPAAPVAETSEIIWPLQRATWPSMDADQSIDICRYLLIRIVSSSHKLPIDRTLYIYISIYSIQKKTHIPHSIQIRANHLTKHRLVSWQSTNSVLVCCTWITFSDLRLFFVALGSWSRSLCWTLDCELQVTSNYKNPALYRPSAGTEELLCVNHNPMTSNDNHIRGDGEEDMADDNDHAAAAAVCAGGGGAEIGFIRIHWFSLNDSVQYFKIFILTS